MTGLASGDVTRALGISRRRLQHWRRTRLVTPSGRTAGGHSRYTEADLRRLRLVRVLADHGVSIQRVRAVGISAIAAEVERMILEECDRTAQTLLAAVRSSDRSPVADPGVVGVSRETPGHEPGKHGRI